MTKDRRERIRARLQKLEVDALFVTKPVNVRYTTAFSGSNGQLLIGSEDVFLTDPRYEEQSSKECGDVRREIYGTSAKQIGESAGVFALLESVLRELGVSRLGVEAGFMTLSTARQIREQI
ncbi:MAG TPA: aminopeptidase P family N-terminal domain-containing protein, partial [Actinomycetota bacterium]|nr:aminopeptidase P family N-terminal domain-containing protein [Actinomycetota bacterium]